MQNLYGLVAAASKKVGRSKQGMSAVLGQLRALGKEQKADPEYLKELGRYEKVLAKSKDVKDFLAAI